MIREKSGLPVLPTIVKDYLSDDLILKKMLYERDCKRKLNYLKSLHRRNHYWRFTVKFEKTEVNIKTIPNFPRYTISSDGSVVNQEGIFIKPEITSNGYLRVSLSNDIIKHKRFLIHRLVAKTFIPNPNGLSQVNHINEDKTDNHVENLEWCTPLDNLNHSQVIQKAGFAKLTKIRCVNNGQLYNSLKEVEEKLGLNHSNLSACCSGKRKNCGGMQWEYVI